MTSSIEEINLSKGTNDEKKPKPIEDADLSDLIVCQLCPLTFSRQCNYKRHLEVVHSIVEDPLKLDNQGVLKKEKLFECSKCPRTFIRQVNLSKHFETHKIFQSCKKELPDRVSPNESCGLDDSPPREGEKDEEKDEEKKNVYCTICNRNFFYETALEKHKELHRTKQAIFSCSHCSQKFFQKTNLVQHEYTHTRPVHSCVICNKSFNKVVHLKTHLKTHTKDIAAMNCDKCGKTFKSKTSLELHMKNHLTSAKFRCNGCEAEFTNKASFLRHVQIKISNSMRYRCAFCGKVCCHKKNLDIHLTTHSIGNLSFKCDKCSEVFMDKIEFQKHLNVHIVMPTKFSCIYCNENLTSESELVLHKKANDGSALKCSDCNQPVECRGELATHRCMRKSNVSNELRTAEYFLDTYSEVLLEASSYKTPSNKAKHRDHTYALQSWPIKPYKCKKCGRHFCRLVNLEKHIQEIHPFYLSAESSEENSDDENVKPSKRIVMPRIASVTSLQMENEKIFVSGNNFQDQIIEQEDELVDPLSIDNEHNHNETEMQIGNVRSIRNVVKIEPRSLEDDMSQYYSPRITEVNLIDIKQEAIEYESS